MRSNSSADYYASGAPDFRVPSSERWQVPRGGKFREVATSDSELATEKERKKDRSDLFFFSVATSDSELAIKFILSKKFIKSFDF
jgi:hypothetical protein